MIENKEQQASELRDAIKITSEIWCQLIKLWKKIYAVAGEQVAPVIDLIEKIETAECLVMDVQDSLFTLYGTPKTKEAE